MYKIASIFLVFFFAIGSMSSCKSSKKASTEGNVDFQQANQKFYLMLRLAREGESVRVENIEKEVYTDQNNPLPLPPGDETGETFRCEVLDINNQVIATHEVKSEFQYGTPDSGPEAIVKFIFRIDAAAHSVRVSRELKDGVWEEILTTSAENEKTDGSKN